MYKNIKKPLNANQQDLKIFAENGGTFCFSPKADGVFQKRIIGGKKFIGEYVESLNLFLVFDTESAPFNRNLVERMKWIRSLHPLAKELPIPTFKNTNEISDIVKRDNQLLKQTVGNYEWYPKILFHSKFIGGIGFLKILDTTLDLPYGTDGWIINSLFRNKIVKYKPFEHLTVDLLKNGSNWLSLSNKNYQIRTLDGHQYEDGYVYRCYWENSGWVAKEKRVDKDVPNSDRLVAQVQYMHIHPWRASDIINILHVD